MTNPYIVLLLVGAVAFCFACGFVAGVLSTKYRR